MDPPPACASLGNVDLVTGWLAGCWLVTGRLAGGWLAGGRGGTSAPAPTG